jgi:2-iminobutanoate/2-iminopropanoate deaminase
MIATEAAPAAIGPYAQANKVGDLIFTSGQLPLDPITGEMPEGIEAQTAQSLANLKAILEAGGSNINNVVKTTVLLAEIDDFAAMNGVYESFFTEGLLPSRSAFAVKDLPKAALVEIEAVAVVG